MTREETKQIIRIMVDTYPNYKPSNISETIDVWASMLTDYSFKEISTALRVYILTNTSGFAPGISNLVQIIQKSQKTESEELNELEAWTLVSKALRNSGYHSQEEFDKLPPIVQKSVGSPQQLHEWSMSPNDSIESVAQSNFMRSYRTELKRAEEKQALPDNVRKLLSAISPAPKVDETKQIERKEVM